MICKICKSLDLRKLYLLQNHQIWKCTNCGFGQVSITPAELSSFYDSDYFSGQKARFGQAGEEDIRPSHAYWLDRQIRLCGSKQELKVLDIGPGLSVGFGKHIRAHHPNTSYEALEFSPYAAESIRARGYVVHCGRPADPEIVDACRGRFDLIVGTEVIEHDPEPHAFIASVRAMLKPGGRCAFTTGNLDGLVARKQGAKWYYLDPPAHVCYYTPKAATILFRSEDFTRIDNWRVGFNYFTLKLKTHIPGILTVPHLLHLPTGMTISAHRPEAT